MKTKPTGINLLPCQWWMIQLIIWLCNDAVCRVSASKSHFTLLKQHKAQLRVNHSQNKSYNITQLYWHSLAGPITANDLELSVSTDILQSAGHFYQEFTLTYFRFSRYCACVLEYVTTGRRRETAPGSYDWATHNHETVLMSRLRLKMTQYSLLGTRVGSSKMKPEPNL